MEKSLHISVYIPSVNYDETSLSLFSVLRTVFLDCYFTLKSTLLLSTIDHHHDRTMNIMHYETTHSNWLKELAVSSQSPAQLHNPLSASYSRVYCSVNIINIIS